MAISVSLGVILVVSVGHSGVGGPGVSFQHSITIDSETSCQWPTTKLVTQPTNAPPDCSTTSSPSTAQRSTFAATTARCLRPRINLVPRTERSGVS